MRLQERILSYGIILWIVTNFIVRCNSLSNPRLNFEHDDDDIASFAATKIDPLITPISAEITLQVGSNFTLFCESKEPILWRALTPVSLELNISSYNSVDSDWSYGNRLHLNNVTAEYVGYFYCIKQKELIEDGDYDILVKDFKAAKIYIFVNDTKALLVPMAIPLIRASQQKDIVIPCKPTMRETVVELFTSDDKVLSSNTTARYDPKHGFVVQIQTITQGGQYVCKPRRPSPLNKREAVNFIIFYSGNESNPILISCISAEPGYVKKQISHKRSSEQNQKAVRFQTKINGFDLSEIQMSFSLPKFVAGKTMNLAMPQIHSNSNGHAVKGETFNLTCTVEMESFYFNDRLPMKWKTPIDDNMDGRLSWTNVATHSNDKNLYIGKSFLTVTNAQESDGGNYKCIVKDYSRNSAHNTFLMTILKNGESYINISEPNKHYTITEDASKRIILNVIYRGYPTPSFKWLYGPELKLIRPSEKYKINQTYSSISLQINNVELVDTGTYVLKAENGKIVKELEFNVYIKAKPQISIENVYVQVGEQARLLCMTHAYPKEKVTWSFTPCNISPKWPSCSKHPDNFHFVSNSSEISKISRMNELIFKPDRPGRIKCTAINTQGNSSSDSYVLIGDISDNMTVYGVDDNLQIAKGDEVVLTCAALAYYYSADLDWFKDGRMISNSSGVEVKAVFSNYSYKKIIKFKNIKDVHGGSYECRARVISNDTDYESKFLSIVVHEPTTPFMVQTNLGDRHKRTLGESLELICKSEGLPKVSITWYKDGEKLNAGENILIMEDNSVLKIPYIKPSDEGLYKCVASNRLGNIESSSQVKITNMPGLKIGWIIAIVILVSFLIILVIYLGIRILKEREVLLEMKLAGLVNFEEGALEQINPTMSLDEQADLLPYDRRFEFPRDKLKLGKKLGSGAFGVVLKGYAEGIFPEEKETVVAVKMAKRTADNEVIKALVSELKIMVHLGQHLNVVNLLGAVTKNIAKREIMVIVEYCRYGNVQNFLQQNRKRFINQINPITDKIDPTFVKERFSRRDSNLSRNSVTDRQSGIYTERSYSSYYSGKSVVNEYYFDGYPTEETVLPTISEGEDQILSTNSIQSDGRSSYYKSNSTNAMTINTSDLVSWAFQVTRGMDYLSSRKVFHGDLAARNILLCEDNVVKICDFGLARSMYKNENYKKQHKALLPIKWLALESLSDQVFNTYTDVWSFGIMLWEFFSLATVPYPGIDANHTLYLKLKDGYRMEKPPYANEELYDIMLKCWNFKPESRPLFHELEKKFARLLGEEVTNHYVDLNEPYLKINNELIQQSGRDYLGLMGSPDEMAPPPPPSPSERYYVNGMIGIDPSVNYFQMNTKTKSAAFSNRIYEDNIGANNSTVSEQPTMSTNLAISKKSEIVPEENSLPQKSTNGNRINRRGSHSDFKTDR